MAESAPVAVPAATPASNGSRDGANSNGGFRSGFGGGSVASYDERIGVALIVCFIASVIEFSAALDACDHRKTCGHARYEWAVGCGILSATICLLRLALIKFLPTGLDQRADAAFATCLILLWVGGAAFNTSQKGPFGDTENGYFATWLAFGAAAHYAILAWANVSDKIKQLQLADGLSLLLIASLIELSVAADRCSQKHVTCDHSDGAAVAVGAVSVVIAGLQTLLDRFAPDIGQLTSRILSPVLVALWAVGAALNTSSKGPFSSSCSSANGYFATWASFFFSLMYLYGVFVHPPAAKQDYEQLPE
ncbi:uncharacterized protein MONBRDRAFT_31530 [Monosiga brevicollis MX1]|uniref:Uncharacterized protein n=1 Tax=Monosiga brevicollis TaxID=81824 RepID=A9UTS7_MONBE|nr:uncharacterized protein MONBRDRAFT_31530 [Monosiga brevicollis MX1]EDQ91544.1 predicted protein [Monosiga brevicollis MX1]|eukprot:XP_001743966.1 hypothetical protein [Monosiga brevicollis MX1]